MNLAFFISRRLKLISPDSRRSAMTVRVATAGVALSVAVMLLTLAIVRGFKEQIISKITGFESELTISPLNYEGNEAEPISFTPELQNMIAAELPPNAEITPAIALPAMLKTDDNFASVVLKAYGNNKNRSFLNNCIVDGRLPDFSSDDHRNSIVISSTTANSLGLKTGDKINCCFFIDDKIRIRRYDVAAIYDSNFGEYDSVIAFCSMSTLRHIAGMTDDQCGRIEINGLKLDELPECEMRLSKRLNDAYYIGELPQYMNLSSILTTGAVYFSWLQLLDTNVVIILILMGAISVFTLISSLFIMILERIQLIGTLKALGGNNKLIRKTFIILALKIAIRGLIAGNIIGLGCIALQYFFHAVPLDAASYYISYVPVDITIMEVLVLNIASILLALAAMIIPSRIVGRMQVAKILRYE